MLVWSDQVGFTNMRKAQWELRDNNKRRVKKSLTNNGDGSFTASFNLSSLPTSATSWRWKGKLEDNHRTKFQLQVQISVFQQRPFPGLRKVRRNPLNPPFPRGCGDSFLPLEGPDPCRDCKSLDREEENGRKSQEKKTAEGGMLVLFLSFSSSPRLRVSAVFLFSWKILRSLGSPAKRRPLRPSLRRVVHSLPVARRRARAAS